MIAHPFEYRAPESIDELVSLLSGREQGAIVLGGGTMLIPAMTRAETAPSLLVDPRRLGLTDIIDEGHQLRIEARVSYDQVLHSQMIALNAPVLVQMASGITGGRSITSQGTLLGSACYANPASDVPVCLAALRASIRLQSASGVRDVAINEFLVGGFVTSRRQDEVGLGLLIPKPRGRTVSAYRKVKPSGSSWPIITVACLIEETPALGPTLTLAIGGLDSKPICASTTAAFVSRSDHEEFVAQLTSTVEAPWEDALATASYRSLAAPAVALRVMREALEAHNG